LLISRGFSASALDYLDFREKGPVSGNENDPHWLERPERSFDIFSNFMHDNQLADYHLFVDEYRLFENPIKILNAQHYEMIRVMNDESWLTIKKSPNSMYVRFFGEFDSDKIRSEININPQQYESDTFIKYLKTALNFMDDL